MRFSGVSAIAIWNNLTRNLTGMGSATLTSPSVIHTSLANATSVDLRPGLNTFRDCWVVGEALANVTWNPAIYDGTTFRIGPGGASGAAFAQVEKGFATAGPALNNSGTVPGFYNLGGADWHQ